MAFVHVLRKIISHFATLGTRGFFLGIVFTQAATYGNRARKASPTQGITSPGK